MSFADLLGDLAGDFIRGNTRTAQYRLKNYLSKAAKQGIKAGVERAQKGPPPVPGQAPGAPPPVPGGAADAENTAWILLRAMISAAASDGTIDDSEQDRILSKAAAVDLPQEDVKKIQDEMAAPLSPEAVAQLARTPTEREQVYLVSMNAIEVDSPAERIHLERLAKALGMDIATVTRLESELNQPPPVP